MICCAEFRKFYNFPKELFELVRTRCMRKHERMRVIRASEGKVKRHIVPFNGLLILFYDYVGAEFLFGSLSRKQTIRLTSPLMLYAFLFFLIIYLFIYSSDDSLRDYKSRHVLFIGYHPPPSRLRPTEQPGGAFEREK